MDTQQKPIIEILNQGGYRIRLSESSALSGAGPTLRDAIADLAEAVARTYDTEKGDESAEAQTAARQTDLLANDRFIRGGQLQQSVMMAFALGLI